MVSAHNRYILVILFCLFIASCAGLDYFKSEPEPDEKPPVQAQVSEEPKGQTSAEQTEDMDQLQNKIGVLEEKIDSLESQVAGQKKVVYTIEYSDPAQLYQKARTLLLENDTNNAADLFSTFAKEHPDHSLADNALYWLGECHYSQGRYEKAISIFKDLVKQYPKAEKVPDALLKTGYAYLSLDDVNRASHFLKQVIKKYPFSPAAEKAQAKLTTFQ